MPADLAAAFVAINCTPGAWVAIPTAISLVYDGRNSTKTNKFLEKLRKFDPELDERVCGLSEDLLEGVVIVVIDGKVEKLRARRRRCG